MNNNTIEMWERIGFKNGEAVTWERSYDEGKTWSNVEWYGDKLPFIFFGAWKEEVEYVQTRRVLMEEETGAVR